MSESENLPEVPVVMSVWRRVHLLENTLSLLAAQRGVRANLHVINNNPGMQAAIERIAAGFHSRMTITIVRGDNRFGCFARFLYMHKLRRRYPFIIVIDDDQVFGHDFLRTLWHDRIAGGVVGCHAFQFHRRKDYWRKQRLRAGAVATYCGPGGMIIDSGLLEAPALLACPSEYMMMDDIWLAYVLGHRLKAPMAKSAAKVEMIDLAADTWHRIREEKILMLETLRDTGWEA
jgi:hypothetical protein